MGNSNKRFHGDRESKFPAVWFAPDVSQGAYLARAWAAQLGKNEKHLLTYIASMSDFSKTTPCWAGTKRICNDLDICKDTLNRTKAKLQDLGWVVCYSREGDTDLYYPAIGKPDLTHKFKFPAAREATEAAWKLKYAS